MRITRAIPRGEKISKETYIMKPLFTKLAIGLTSLFILVSCGLSTTLSVQGNTLYMDGVINGNTPKQMKEMFANHPNIDTIVMLNVPGSINDEANLEVATWVADKKVTMRLNSGYEIASGGTDFFLAGARRIIERGALVGVHSWAEGFGGVTATDYPRGHEYHQPYIDYYKKVGFTQQQAEDFYYFTINAAPANDIHFMTEEELLRYNIVTEPLK